MTSVCRCFEFHSGSSDSWILFSFQHAHSHNSGWYNHPPAEQPMGHGSSPLGKKSIRGFGLAHFSPALFGLRREQQQRISLSRVWTVKESGSRYSSFVEKTLQRLASCFVLTVGPSMELKYYFLLHVLCEPSDTCAVAVFFAWHRMLNLDTGASGAPTQNFTPASV